MRFLALSESCYSTIFAYVGIASVLFATRVLFVVRLPSVGCWLAVFDEIQQFEASLTSVVESFPALRPVVLAILCFQAERKT